MQPQGQSFLPPAAPVRFAGEVSAALLLATLSDHKDKTLIFAYEGNDVQAGYHVTK